MNWKIIWEKEGAIIEFHNDISIYDVINADLMLRKDSKFDNLKYIVSNFLEIDSKNLSMEDTELSAKIDSPVFQWNNNITYISITKDQYLIELLKNYDRLVKTPNWNHIITDTMNNARKIIKSL